MSESAKRMHETFLAEIRTSMTALHEEVTAFQEKLAALQENLETLRAVEKYHSQRLAEASGEPVQKEEATDQKDVAGDRGKLLLRYELEGASKHEAAEVAIRELGGKARIPMMIEFLHEHGYGTDLERRVLHNSLYTAMTRHSERFENSDGAWVLIADGKEGAEESSNE